MDRVTPMVYLDWHAMRPERRGDHRRMARAARPYRYYWIKSYAAKRRGLLAFTAPLLSTFCKDSAVQISLKRSML